ncbi:SIR2 family protein [Arenimonas terrae]|nr:SIR2 family protein [Arenimonas terrae]
MKDDLVKLLNSRQAGPFLFVGSGFSRRYVELEDWHGLLSRFCVGGKPFEYYLAAADGSFPVAAGLLAKDFNEHWWSSPDYKDSVEKEKARIKDSTSALRIEISRYLLTLDQAKAKKSKYYQEFEMLAGLNVDGVITTNWDQLLEQIFTGYKVFIGQKELLFSNPQQIGEIYKIHGCSTRPSSLVLTADDYREFNDRNAYLAAKLITIFVEHPIIFIGYSLADENIASLLRAIALCIGREQVEQLRRNLIFVQRPRADAPEGVSDTYLTIDGVQIPLVLVSTDDLRPLFEALSEVKRKIPARVLRYCKEQLYALVASSEPESKLCVVDYDEIDNHEDVEFLVGVGVANQTNHKSGPDDHHDGVGDVGYAAIEANDLFRDVLHEEGNFRPDQILKHVIKRAGKNSRNIPVFKYLHEAGIRNEEDYKKSGLDLGKWVSRDYRDFRVKAYQQVFFKHRHLSMKDLLQVATVENASGFIPCMTKEKVDLELLRGFLKDNEEKLYSKGPYASNFRKLATLYDKLKWGW